MDVAQQIFYFLAGLAIFYFGQRTLSQGLQAIGASSLKHIVHDQKERNPLTNFLHGARLTLISFSTTMSSLVIIGLVNANLVKNRRVLPMMLGTTLGASAIFFILSFYGHTRALNLIASGLLVGLIFRTYRARSLGKFIIGLGLMFLGLSVMEEAIKFYLNIHDISHFISYINSFPHFITFLIATLIGMALSISLTSAIMVLAIVSVISRLGLFVTTLNMSISCGAIIASFYMTFVTAKSSARAFAIRKALVPLLITILSVIFLYVFYILVSDYVSFGLSEVDKVVSLFGLLSFLSLVINYIFKSPFVNLAKKLYPDDEVVEQSKLQFLGEGRFLSSTMAYVLVEMEVSKLLDIVDRMLAKSRDYLVASEKGARSLAKIKDYERIVDNIQVEIDIFIQKVISNGAGEDESQVSLSYLKISSGLEQIADEVDKICTTLTKIYEKGTLKESEIETILVFFDEVHKMFKIAMAVFDEEMPLEKISTQERKETLSRALEIKKEILSYRMEIASHYVESDETLKTLYLSDLLISLAKLRGKVRDIYKVVIV